MGLGKLGLGGQSQYAVAAQMTIFKLTRGQAGVTLNVDVEGNTKIDRVAFLGTSTRAVAVQDVVGEVGVLLSAAIQITELLEVERVARWDDLGERVGLAVEEWVLLESLWGVWHSVRCSTSWLWVTGCTLELGSWCGSWLNNGSGAGSSILVVCDVALVCGSNWCLNHCWRWCSCNGSSIELLVLSSYQASKGCSNDEGLHFGELFNEELQ